MKDITLHKKDDGSIEIIRRKKKDKKMYPRKIRNKLNKRKK